MKLNFFIFFFLFFLNIYYISFTSSQLIQSNDNVKLYIDINNKYASYGNNDDYSTCTFKNKIVVTNIGAPSYFGSSPLVATQDQSQFILEVDQQANSQNVSYQFSISDPADSTFSTTFTLYLYCEKLEDTSLIVESLNQVPVESGFNLYYFYISIKSLKYSLSNLKVSTSTNGITVKSITISKEYYLVEFTTSNIGLLIDNGLDFSVAFPNKIYDLEQMKPIYKGSSLQQLTTTLEPSTISTFTQYGNGFSPVLIINSDLVNESSYIGWEYSSGITSSNGLLKLISQSQTSNTFILPLLNNNNPSYTYSITFNNGSNIDNAPIFSVVTFNEYQSTQLPLGQVSLQNNMVALNFSSSGYRIKNSPFQIQSGQFNAKVEFPYGFISGTNSNFNFRTSMRATVPKKNSNINDIKIMEYPNGIARDYANPYPSSIDDITPPTILEFQLNHITGFKYSLRVKSSDAIGIFKMEYTKLKSTVSLGYQGLIEGTNSAPVLEYIVDVKYLINGGLKVIDIYLNALSLSKGSIIYRDSNGYPVYFEVPVQDIDLDIENVILLKNNIDILNKENYNRIYFNSSTIPHDYPLEFSLLDPVSLDDLNEGRVDSYPIQWSNEIKMFYCEFIVPKNTGPKYIPYKISSPFREITSEAFTKLIVSNTNFDNDGPLITNIVNANSFGKVGWRITITDQVNGFSNGYIKAIGSKDSSSFKINFTISNVTLPGTANNGQYDIILDINSNGCASQDYVIEYIYLEDSNKRYSKYSRYESNYLPEKDPLRYLSDEIISASNPLITTSTCVNELNDPSPPVMLSFTPSISAVDVSSNSRYANFTIVVEDNETGIMISQTPKIYLGSSNDIFKCDSQVQTFNSTTATFTSQCLLPFAFGYPLNSPLVSVYGLFNNAGYFSGYANDANELKTKNVIPTRYLLSPILLSYEPVYYHSKSDIIIYGRLIGSTTSVSILYSNGTTLSYSPTIIGQSALIIKKDNIDIVGPFDVTAFSSSSTTNTLRVYPIYFEATNFDPNPTPTPTEPTPTNPTSTPTPTTTPIPTNKPQQCIGTPECGGSNHGYCVENQGCVCYSPWIGSDCLSRVIIIPPPQVNDTEPSIEIPIIDSGNNSNSNNETSTIFYKSLISIVSLREISIDGKPIKDKSYSFDKWIFDQVDSTTNQYYSNITTKDNSNVVNVNVTLKWFENETNIQFANQSLIMSPSSIKYTIEINNYQFENKLNTLELVMKASFISNSTSNSCSSKEFGDTTSGDNSNYLKIQIENRSLYGRFIKRCILDDSTISSLNNKLLDAEMNSISNPSQVQTYIGISIPNFNNKVIIDPDFSVILNPNSASSSSSNSICSNSSSSKLSSTKIAGIIIGCVAFASVITIGTIYAVYKTKQYSKLKRSVDIKLKNHNQ